MKNLIIAEKDSQAESLAIALELDEKRLPITIPNKEYLALQSKRETASNRLKTKLSKVREVLAEYESKKKEKIKGYKDKLAEMEEKSDTAKETKAYQIIVENIAKLEGEALPKYVTSQSKKLKEYKETLAELDEQIALKEPTLEKRKVRYWDDDENTLISCAGHIIGIKFSTSSDEIRFDTEWNPPSPTNASESFKWEKFHVIKYFIESGEFDQYICATDYDREGQSIFFSLMEYFGVSPDKCARMKFSTLEPAVLKDAFDDLKEFDMDFYYAGKVRRWMDYVIGYNINPILAVIYREGIVDYLEEIGIPDDKIQIMKYNNTFNAGRVKLVILKKIADHTKEQIKKQSEIEDSDIDEEEYTIHHFSFIDNAGNKIYVINKRDTDTKILPHLDLDKEILMTIDEVSEDSEEKGLPVKYPKDIPNFLNMTEAFNICSDIGASTKEVNSILQYLYLQQYISYPRSRSQRWEIDDEDEKYEYAMEIVDMLEKLDYPVKEYYRDDAGNEGLDSHSHPAIHPLKSVTPEKVERLKQINPLAYIVFNKICLHTCKCFEKLPVVRTQTVKGTLTQGDYSLEITWNRIIDIEEKNILDYEGYYQDDILVPINADEGDSFVIDHAKIDYIKQKVIKNTWQLELPTDFEIIQFLNEKNIGTDATRAVLLSELIDTQYIYSQNVLVTTFLGHTLNKIAEKFIDFIDIKYTLDIDEDLQEIEDGELMVDEFKEKIKEYIISAIDEIKENKDEIIEYFLDTPICEKHDTPMVVRAGAFGRYLQCPYKETEEACDNTITISIRS